MSMLERLHNRIDLTHIPYTERGSRILMFHESGHICLRLAERWERWQNEVGHYRQRPPVIDGFVIQNAEGEPLAFEVDTYPHRVRLSTTAGDFDWTFVDPETLLVRLPAGKHRFVFVAHGLRAQTDRRGGTLHGKRNIAYTTNAALADNEITAQPGERFKVQFALHAHDGDVLLLNVTPRLGYNRSLPVPDKAIAESRASWEAWFSAVPPVLETYRAQYAYAWWIMRSGLLNTRYFFTREALVPSKIHYIGVWQWDQFFHAIAFRHIDTRLAEDQLRIVLDHQRDDGMLPDAIHDEGLVTHLARPVDEDVTKPPLIAWAALKLYAKSGHLDFLQEIYEPLLRWHDWWVKYNLNVCGLSEYRHPFSSGLDDSPLWDDGMPVVAPDLNTYLCIQHESMGRIAAYIGAKEDAARFNADADQWAARMIKVLWNEQQGIFDALHNGRRVDVLTPFQLLPLWTGRLPESINTRLIERLTDPAAFWGQRALPTVAFNDPKFDPEQMWRGPVWANINYLFIEALNRIGRLDLAGTLRRKTLELVKSLPDIYEYYNPLDGTPPVQAAPLFGWTAAVYIDLAIKETQAAEP